MTSPITTINPATGATLATYLAMDAAAVESAAAKADAVARAWGQVPVSDRVASLRRLATTLRRDCASLARLISSEMGKPLREAEGEVEKSLAEPSPRALFVEINAHAVTHRVATTVESSTQRDRRQGVREYCRKTGLHQFRSPNRGTLQSTPALYRVLAPIFRGPAAESCRECPAEGRHAGKAAVLRDVDHGHVACSQQELAALKTQFGDVLS